MTYQGKRREPVSQALAAVREMQKCEHGTYGRCGVCDLEWAIRRARRELEMD